MNSIAHQMVAVVATLSGFVAHDYLRAPDGTVRHAARPAVTDGIDPVVTRAIDLSDVSIDDWTGTARDTQARMVTAPATAFPRAARATRPDSRVSSTIAEGRINNVRIAAPGRRSGMSALR